MATKRKPTITIKVLIPSKTTEIYQATIDFSGTAYSASLKRRSIVVPQYVFERDWATRLVETLDAARGYSQTDKAILGRVVLIRKPTKGSKS